jgi:hypothetical protein
MSKISQNWIGINFL